MNTSLLTIQPAPTRSTESHPASLSDTLSHLDNDYRSYTQAWSSDHHADWTRPAPAPNTAGTVSVVVPMRNRSSLITHVLDGIATSRNVDVEVIVVDDASSDDGAFRAAAHPARPTVVRLDQPHGSSVARNIGTAMATADTVIYLDADMIVSTATLAEFASRAHDDLVLLGFRHHLPVAAWLAGPLAPTVVDINQDPRVESTAGPGVLPFTREILDRPHLYRLLDLTDDLLELGHGRHVFDWSLPRTMITAMISVPRQAVIDTGGFHPGFHGLWGAEDAYVGAKLIAAGCKVAPVRPAVGFHLDTADHPSETQMKQSSLARTVAFYRSLLAQPMPVGGAQWFHGHTSAVLRDATVIRH